MKKVRGKALALVLSIALVVSSFSTAFSSAASRSEKAVDIDGGIGKQVLVNGGADEAARSVELVGSDLTPNLITKKHESVSANLVALSRASGSDLVKWKLEDTDEDDNVDKVTLTLRSKDSEGTETVKALYKARVTDDDDNVTTYTYTSTFDVKVFANLSVVIGTAGTDAPDPNTDPTFTDTFAVKTLAHELVPATGAADSHTLAVYQVKQTGTTAVATWTNADTNYTLTSTSNVIKDAESNKFTVADSSGIGNVTITATRSSGTEDAFPDNKVTVKSKITKTLKVNTAAATEADYIHFIKHSSTVLANGTDPKGNGYKEIAVTGYEVNFDGTAAVDVAERASVDKISGTVGSLEIKGSVSTVDVQGDVTVTGGKAKGGNITAKGKVTVEDGAAAKDISAKIVAGKADSGKVSVTNATVGNITAEGTVSVLADSENTIAKTGDITAQADVTLDASQEDTAKISVDTLTTDSDAGIKYEISGNVTIGGVDFDYYESTLSFTNFQGKVPAPQNVKDDASTIIATDPDDSVEVVGNATLGSVTANDGTTIKFDGTITANNIEGPGSVVIKAGSLKVIDGIYGATLKLTDDPITSGLKVLTADAGAVDVDDFTPYGYTLKMAEGNDYDTFSVDKLQFVGLKISGNGRIVKESKATFTASAYPTGSAIPEGYTVDWSVDNTDKFTATPNADGSVTVEAANFDEDFASENKGVLTATLVDEDGYEYDEDYEPGTLDLTEIKVPDTTYKSDTTGNLNKKVGETYQFAITSLDGKAKTLVVAGGGATVNASGAEGNTSYFKVTPTKEGSFGVYVDGVRLAILVVKGSTVTTDTKAVTKAPGQVYQFKITAPSQPTFVAVGLQSVLAQHTGNDYFYKVTASNVKGGHGVYVNGVRLAIFTVA